MDFQHDSGIATKKTQLRKSVCLDMWYTHYVVFFQEIVAQLVMNRRDSPLHKFWLHMDLSLQDNDKNCLQERQERERWLSTSRLWMWTEEEYRYSCTYISPPIFTSASWGIPMSAHVTTAVEDDDQCLAVVQPQVVSLLEQVSKVSG